MFNEAVEVVGLYGVFGCLNTESIISLDFYLSGWKDRVGFFVSLSWREHGAYTHGHLLRRMGGEDGLGFFSTSLLIHRSVWIHGLFVSRVLLLQ
jgi:hypothetical protein